MGVLNFVTGFLVGGYAGLYVSKHYNVPDVPAPQELLEALKKLADSYKKKDD